MMRLEGGGGMRLHQCGHADLSFARSFACKAARVSVAVLRNDSGMPASRAAFCEGELSADEDPIRAHLARTMACEL
jgi:hypothetical protein